MRTWKLPAAAALSAVLTSAGCPSPAPQADDLRAAPPDLAPPDQESSQDGVSGTALTTYVTDSGEVSRPRDLSATAVAALVPAGAGLRVIEGQGRADGSFAIAAVPAGTYYLRVGTTYVVTAERSLDLGREVLGRPEQRAPSPGTALALDVKGLSPWAADDAVELFSSNANAYIYDAAALGAPAPMAGATQLALRVPFAANGYGGGNLIQGDLGDRAYLFQVTGRTSDKGLPYGAIAKNLLLPPFTMKDGAETALAGSFTDVLQTEAASFSWRRSLFAALGSSMSPAAADPRLAVALFCQPGGVARAGFSATPDLLTLSSGEATDVETGTLRYGNPFPAAWPLVASATVSFTVKLRAPAAPADTSIQVSAGRLAAAAALLGAPVAPDLGPVQSPLLNGKGAFDPQAGVGETPLVAWTAPALGRPGRYAVTVHRLFTADGKGRSEALARLYTADTSVLVPPGILKAGERYFLRIAAESAPLSPRPLRSAAPLSYAEALTATFTP